MKIAICSADSFATGFYRLLQPYKALCDARGYELSIVEEEGDKNLDSADVAVFQRTGSERSLGLVERLASLPNRPKIIFDADDDCFHVPAANPASKYTGRGKPFTENMLRAASLADLVTCSTDVVASLYAPFNANRVVCPNSLDDEAFAAYSRMFLANPKPKRLGQIRIGWAGGMGHQGDIATVVKPLQKILDSEPRAKLVFFGDEFRPLFRKEYWARIETIPPIASEQPLRPSKYGYAMVPAYYERLANIDLDIAIAPLERQIYAKAKSCLRLLEYALANVPVICARYGPYGAYATLQPQAVVAVASDDARAWFREIRNLMDDGQRRVELAEENRKTVSRWYTMSANLNCWGRAVDSVMEAVAA